MKYIILETEDGAKYPFIFPEAMTHSIVASVMQYVLPGHKSVVSAGFVEIGTDVTVYGESESLGGLKSNAMDSARIMLGASIQHMPDDMLPPLISMMLAREGK